MKGVMKVAEKIWERLPEIENALKNGNIINKREATYKYGVSEREIQRDIAKLKEKYAHKTNVHIDYKRSLKGYVMTVDNNNDFTNSEILAVCKIILESRAFNETDMKSVLEKLLKSCTRNGNYKGIMQAIANETEHYRGPYHKKSFVELLWDISTAIRNQKFITFDYMQDNGDIVEIKSVKPAGIMFSEHYFYMIVYTDKKGTENYRIDKVENLSVSNEGFRVPYAERFQEGEYRKHIINMVGGKSRIVKFRICKQNVEKVKDMFPEATVTEIKGSRYQIRTEVFGNGADDWFRKNSDIIEMLEDKEIAENNATDLYDDSLYSEIEFKIELFKRDDLRDPFFDGTAISFSLISSKGSAYKNVKKYPFEKINITCITITI